MAHAVDGFPTSLGNDAVAALGSAMPSVMAGLKAAFYVTITSLLSWIWLETNNFIIRVFLKV